VFSGSHRRFAFARCQIVMPQEVKVHQEVLAAIDAIGAISDLTAKHDGQYQYELDLEVIVYGRNYGGKKVGPYVRLLSYSPGEVIVKEGDWGGNTFFIVVEGRAEVFVTKAGEEVKAADLPAGTQFGEMSVLAGVPRASTVRASQERPVQVLELQRPALRLLRKIPRFSTAFDTEYRRYGRTVALQTLGTALPLGPDAVKLLEHLSTFRVYSKNHVLFRAGDPISRIYVLKSGWARLAVDSQPPPRLSGDDIRGENWSSTAEETYAGPLRCFGVEAITRNVNWTQTCVLLGRTEVLEISVSKVRQSGELREALVPAFGKIAAPLEEEKTHSPLPVAAAQRELIETGLVDATNLLVMDMDLCVRCGNCSLACHRVHGQSRLVRRGIHVTRPVSLQKRATIQSLLSPEVCLHCKDPECLTGCPTGAIGRYPGGEVDINPKTCIGCGDCATQCPYNAISMVPRKPKPVKGEIGKLGRWFRLRPEPLPAAVEQTDDLLAIKCNLCAGTGLNPARKDRQAYSCEENCPTGALLRVDPQVYFSEIQNITRTIFRDATHAIARNVSHIDWGKRALHMIGLALTLAVTVGTVLGLRQYGLERPLIGKWLDMRWLTGLVGLAAIVGVMAYPVRRQIYRRRAGPLRYWMLVHSYLGVIAGILFLLHGGRRGGGLLTTLLMISFDLVVLTGLVGIVCYYCAPRILTRIEGQPLLLEDLTLRRQELNDEIVNTVANASHARALFERRVLPRLFSIGYLFRLYLKSEPLSAIVDKVKTEFRPLATTLQGQEQGVFLDAVELAATARQVDALIYLHQALKVWLVPHVVLTSLMLALLIAHIGQVVFFSR
jgi:Fe-S-cluster-containing dehydrogenase component/CRP-like cAMP-binding protein